MISITLAIYKIIIGSGWTNKNWLISRFHFSFAEYSNPRNLNFGVLRVMNDDLVQPKRGRTLKMKVIEHDKELYKFIHYFSVSHNKGFGAHPHRDVEICTYIVEGHLTHKDSTGTEETLQRGAIQFMVSISIKSELRRKKNLYTLITNPYPNQLDRWVGCNAQRAQSAPISASTVHSDMD
jgi:hypothetical protein